MSGEREIYLRDRTFIVIDDTTNFAFDEDRSVYQVIGRFDVFKAVRYGCGVKTSNLQHKKAMKWLLMTALSHFEAQLRRELQPPHVSY